MNVISFNLFNDNRANRYIQPRFSGRIALASGPDNKALNAAELAQLVKALRLVPDTFYARPYVDEAIGEEDTPSMQSKLALYNSTEYWATRMQSSLYLSNLLIDADTFERLEPTDITERLDKQLNRKAPPLTLKIKTPALLRLADDIDAMPFELANNIFKALQLNGHPLVTEGQVLTVDTL